MTMEFHAANTSEDSAAMKARLRQLFARVESIYMAQPDQALAELQVALQQAQQLGDEALLATAERHYARVLLNLGRDEEGMEYANASLHRFERLHDALGIGYALLSVGSAYMHQGNFAYALSAYERAQRIALQRGEEELELRACGNLNLVYTDLQRYEQARVLLERTMELARRLHMPHLELRAQSNLGHLYLLDARNENEIGRTDSAQFKLQQAQQCLVQCLQDSRTTLSPSDLALTHLAMANVCLDLDRLQAAQEHLQHTEAAVSPHTAPATVTQNLVISWAMLHHRQGRHQPALASLQALLNGQHGEPRANIALQAWKMVAEIAELAGDLPTALQAFKQHYRLNLVLVNERVNTQANALSLKMQAERAQIEANVLRLQAEQLASHNNRLTNEADALTRQVHEDGLTALSNRRYFDEQFPKLLADVDVEQTLYIAMADLDHFKDINDHFSHAMGDEVLRQVSAILRAHSRAGDLVARYGGEEFVLLLRHVNAEQALAACQRLRAAVEHRNWQALTPDLHVTMSIGLVQCNPHLSAQANIEAADKMLYQAKHQGRNQVCM
jgi:diguanylate cyclase (GGDEF)-like protein